MSKFLYNEITFNYLNKNLNTNKIYFFFMPNIALYCDCYNNNRINRENKVYILLNQEINNNYKNISNLVSKYFKKIKLENKDKMVDDFVKQHYFDKMKLIDKFSKYKLGNYN